MEEAVNILVQTFREVHKTRLRFKGGRTGFEFIDIFMEVQSSIKNLGRYKEESE